MLRQAGVVSFLGSSISLGGLFLALLFGGYIELEYIFLELFSALTLGFLLMVSTFVAISILKGTEYWLERRQSMRLE
jgi:hypothetical protein